MQLTSQPLNLANSDVLAVGTLGVVAGVHGHMEAGELLLVLGAVAAEGQSEWCVLWITVAASTTDERHMRAVSPASE